MPDENWITQFNFNPTTGVCDLVANHGDNQNVFSMITGPKMCGNFSTPSNFQWRM
jgi:hypothetical protein